MSTPRMVRKVILPQCYTISVPEFFQFSHDTVRDTRYAWQYCCKPGDRHLQQDDKHFAYKQSIMALTSSSLFCRLKFMKFVSIKTRYGGTSSVLWARNIDDATCGLKCRCWWYIQSIAEDSHPSNCLGFLFLFLSFLLQLILFSASKNSVKSGLASQVTHNLASLGFKRRLTAANFLVFFAVP